MVYLIQVLYRQSVLRAGEAEIQILGRYVVEASYHADVLMGGVVATFPEHIIGIDVVRVRIVDLVTLFIALSHKRHAGDQVFGKGHVQLLCHESVLPVGLQRRGKHVAHGLGILGAGVAYRLHLLLGVDSEHAHPQGHHHVILQRHVALLPDKHLLGDVAKAVNMYVVAPLVAEEVAQDPGTLLPGILLVVP